MKRTLLLITVLSLSFISLPFASEEVHWDYTGKEGPEHWGKLADHFEMCVKGKNQSPIDLVAAIHAELPELLFEYNNLGDLLEENTGHSIQDKVKPGNYLVIKGKKYEFKQFHFHSPSEHTVDGKSFPMEIHLVHQNSAGEYVVTGLIFEEGEHSAVLDQLPSFRASRGESPRSEPVDLNDLIVGRNEYFFYNGSLTTPPCTEGVLWIVIKQPIIASKEQIQHYHDLLGFDNNRPIQPRNARIIAD